MYTKAANRGAMIVSAAAKKGETESVAACREMETALLKFLGFIDLFCDVRRRFFLRVFPLFHCARDTMCNVFAFLLLFSQRVCRASSVARVAVLAYLAIKSATDLLTVPIVRTKSIVRPNLQVFVYFIFRFSLVLLRFF